MADSPDDLVQRAVEAIRANQQDEARKLLAEAIKLDPQNENAWLWLAGIIQNRADRIRSLERVLKINPENQHAIKGLRALGVDPVSEAQPSTQEDLPSVYIPPGSAVPLVNEAVVVNATQTVRGILRELDQDELMMRLNVEWAEPQKPPDKRFDPMEVINSIQRRLPQLSRVQLIVGGLAVGLIVVGTIGFFVITAIQNAQEQRFLASLPTATITLTPTITVTPRPTRTALPDGLELTPEPSQSAGNAPRGDLRFGVTPTSPYINTPHPTSRLRIGIQSYHDGDYQRAIETIQEARDEGDESIDGYFYEGMSFLALGDVNSANRIFTEGLNINNRFAPLHSGVAVVYEREGSIERAISANEEAQSLDSELLMPYLNLALLYANQGDEDEARAEIASAKALEQYEYDTNLLITEAEVNFIFDDYRTATSLSNLAYYIDPESTVVNVMLAKSRLALGLTDSAMVGLEDYLFQINPSDADAWAQLGAIYDEKGRSASALEAYARAIQLAGENANAALVGRGTYYLNRGDFTRAYDDLSTVVEADENNLGVRRLRGQTAFALGLYDEALEDFAFVRSELNEQDLDLEILYLRSLVEAGNSEEVIDATTTLLIQGVPEELRGDLLEARARAYYEEEDYFNGQRDINEALALRDSGLGHYYRGLILEALDRESQAVLDYEWVLFWDGVFGYTFAEDAAERLKNLREDGGSVPTTATPPSVTTPSVTVEAPASDETFSSDTDTDG